MRLVEEILFTGPPRDDGLMRIGTPIPTSSPQSKASRDALTDVSRTSRSQNVHRAIETWSRQPDHIRHNRSLHNRIA